MLVNTVGYLAEAAYHHPDLTVTWARLTVKLQTHSAGGITDKDFELARKIEDVVLWRPATGFPGLEGTPNKWVRSGEPQVDVKAAPATGPVRHRQARRAGAAAGAGGAWSCRSRATSPSCRSRWPR